MTWQNQKFMFVARQEHGITVYDVLWSGGGIGPDFFPEHICTATNKDRAGEVTEALNLHFESIPPGGVYSDPLQ